MAATKCVRAGVSRRGRRVGGDGAPPARRGGPLRRWIVGDELRGRAARGADSRPGQDHRHGLVRRREPLRLLHLCNR
eukprot:3235484-Pleurochrysis_carterae.AAC.2